MAIIHLKPDYIACFFDIVNAKKARFARA